MNFGTNEVATPEEMEEAWETNRAADRHADDANKEADDNIGLSNSEFLDVFGGKIDDELGNPDDSAAHAGSANSSDSGEDDSILGAIGGAITNYFGGDDKNDNGEISNNDSNSEDTTTVTDDGDSEDQGKDNGDSDNEDNDDDKNGKSNNGGMEVDQGPDDNSTADGRWIDQAKVKDTQTSGPGGKGTVDFAPGEEGGSTGEGGIGPGNFKDMSPSQVHTVDGMDAISHEFEDLNQNIQDNIKNGGPATTQIHTTQD